MILRQLTGRVSSYGQDELGCCTWQEVLLNGDHKLIIITAYRITQEHLTGCGHETSAMQQWRQLCARGIETPNPRQQVLDDHTTFISPYETDGHEILLLLDAKSPNDDLAIGAFLNANNLHDLTSDYLPDTPPSTYQRGRSKIDHAWGTIGILMAITSTGVLPFGIGPRSDHAILYLDFSLSTISGIPSASLHDPTHPATQNLWSTDVKAAAKYTELVRTGFKA
jgi:hypothetical protein